MKLKFALAVLLGALLALAAVAQDSAAQAGTPPADTTKTYPQEGRGFVQMLSQKLNLTADQQAKLKPILQQQHQQFMSVREDATLTADQKQAKMKEIREATDTQINGILTPEQQQQFAQMKSQHRGRMKGAAAATPPQ
ncbi:MAG TPA: hypothetical protein VK473_11635 [Terriglobales bacterium]|nr:hypothetical protein [Terriglobales bacterium]